MDTYSNAAVKRVQSAPTDQLLEMLSGDPEQYVPEAWNAAIDELRERNVPGNHEEKRVAPRRLEDAAKGSGSNGSELASAVRHHYARLRWSGYKSPLAEKLVQYFDATPCTTVADEEKALADQFVALALVYSRTVWYGVALFFALCVWGLWGHLTNFGGVLGFAVLLTMVFGYIVAMISPHVFPSSLKMEDIVSTFVEGSGIGFAIYCLAHLFPSAVSKVPIIGDLAGQPLLKTMLMVATFMCLKNVTGAESVHKAMTSHLEGAEHYFDRKALPRDASAADATSTGGQEQAGDSLPHHEEEGMPASSSIQRDS